MRRQKISKQKSETSGCDSHTTIALTFTNMTFYIARSDAVDCVDFGLDCA